MRLWRANRIDQPFEKTPDEIADAFAASPWADRDDLSLETALRMFIADKEPSGLNGAWDPFRPEQVAEFDAAFDATYRRVFGARE